MLSAAGQDKTKEIEFFDRHADADSYDVFMPEAKQRFISAFVRLSGLAPGARVADLGCGSGAFTVLLAERGYNTVGLDISPRLIALARQKFPAIEFLEGDAENLPFENGSLDGVLLSGLVHHFPDPRRLASETFRVLRSGGRFVAFDPSRRNPFMWLYRYPKSPLYSPIGVTENEKPVWPRELAAVFRNAGFSAESEFLAGLPYRYVKSSTARAVLPVYNFIDRWLFTLPFIKPFAPFVLTHGAKP